MKGKDPTALSLLCSREEWALSIRSAETPQWTPSSLEIFSTGNREYLSGHIGHFRGMQTRKAMCRGKQCSTPFYYAWMTFVTTTASLENEEVGRA